MYSTIIVPTDFSNEALTIESLKKSADLSEDGHIILLHALEAVPHDISQTRKTLADWLEKSGVKAEIEVCQGGSSYHEIIESAKENAADLIIMNPHKPGFGDYLLGSTTSKVVRHAPCSVLVDR